MEMLMTFLFSFFCDVCLGDDPYYVAEWSEVIRSCPDFENTNYSFDDLELGSASGSGDDEGGLTLRGNLVILEDLKEAYVMDLQIFKCTGFGDEPMYSVEGDFCSSLKNTDTPWYPIVAKMNTSSCPIPKGEYSLDGLKISIDFAKDVLTHDFCGEYKAQMVMKDNIDMLSCHTLGLAVVEKYDEE
ncbi:uncharacterized protein [Epargyreus clarus]|uniref:uncharacterized protein n=1 Tax=Epargyreus clarus TaxID=520877 RepID=UPI003C2EBE80